jgi:hypothetical protein
VAVVTCRFSSLSVLAVVLGATVVAPTAALADTPGYVSRTEFRHIHKGMGIARVHHIFDTAGKQTAYYDGYRCGTRFGWCPEQDREYKIRSRWGYVSIDYVKRHGRWQVKSRHALWL